MAIDKLATNKVRILKYQTTAGPMFALGRQDGNEIQILAKGRMFPSSQGAYRYAVRKGYIPSPGKAKKSRK